MVLVATVFGRPTWKTQLVAIARPGGQHRRNERGGGHSGHVVIDVENGRYCCWWPAPGRCLLVAGGIGMIGYASNVGVMTVATVGDVVIDGPE